MSLRQCPNGAVARRLSATIMAVACAALVSACTSSTPKVAVSKKGSKEYFAESEYGVKASPRVTAKRSNLPRGGGRYQVGKPYQVKGRWYRPTEDPDYAKVGMASWYGDAFHGRLTANGEVYDMTHLTAAHPTMPLPSYARVTNTKNGHSVMVRVNDRGPFAHDRVIDLSKRAAELLDYTHSGVAQVKVEYVGRAPLEGRDDQYLLASYRPGGAAPDPSDGLPTGVMIAMNGTTPTASLPGVKAADAFAGQPGLASPAPLPVATDAATILPAVGPLVPDRPRVAPPANSGGTDVALLSYADQRIESAASAFDSVLDTRLTAGSVEQWWNGRANAESLAETVYLNAGSWISRAEAEAQAARLAQLGKVDLQTSADATGQVHFTVSVAPDGRMDLDRMLETAWASGAGDAFIVRQ
ncbi:septal ring lytic transglycosylase RlpA family protein [Nitratireductor soli]|uniref:septal ring lytic transglycosylase RlpA family protein n=1 Tax=Nitratireductor soli TaxID=1670619 RepID=UPI00065E032A|nr:septal ring lytic transglycosylase RlpA family protein [Nitratireductor soli]